MLTVYMFIPMIIAIVVQKFIYKESLKEPLGISFKPNRWFLVAWLFSPIIAFAAFGVSLLLHSVEYSPEMVGMFEKMQQSVLTTPEQIEQMRAQFANYQFIQFGFSCYRDFRYVMNCRNHERECRKTVLHSDLF
jgi:hypothetical protein